MVMRTGFIFMLWGCCERRIWTAFRVALRECSLIRLVYRSYGWVDCMSFFYWLGVGQLREFVW